MKVSLKSKLITGNIFLFLKSSSFIILCKQVTLPVFNIVILIDQNLKIESKDILLTLDFLRKKFALKIKYHQTWQIIVDKWNKCGFLQHRESTLLLLAIKLLEENFQEGVVN